MKFLDRNHPMFRRAWVRWACVLIPLGWAVLEFTLSDPLWGILFTAMGVYAAYELIFRTRD